MTERTNSRFNHPGLVFAVLSALIYTFYNLSLNPRILKESSTLLEMIFQNH